MPLSAQITARIAGYLTASPDIGRARHEFDEAAILDLAHGTGEGQADMMWSDERTIAASSSETLDLAGVLSSVFGSTLTFAKVKAVLIVAAAGNTNNVVVGANGSAEFQGWFGDVSDTVAVRPGGMFLIAAPKTGWTVTASTGDILKIANSGSGTGVTYRIVVIGTSA